MRKYKTDEKELRLVKAIETALIFANKEKNVLKQHYTEENFRYVVMNKISEVKCFGTFPNENRKDNLLCFEKKYEKNTFYPDIVSIKYRSNGVNERINKINPLVIELKINAPTTIADKKTKSNSNIPKDIQKIKKMNSCISTDLYKVRQYLKKVDDIQFELGVVMNIGIPKEKKKEPTKDQLLKYILELECILKLHQKEFSKETKSSNKLLFAWFNPLSNKPELFWLNQEKDIVLATKP
jgi:hypothetical protein